LKEVVKGREKRREIGKGNGKGRARGVHWKATWGELGRSRTDPGELGMRQAVRTADYC
jgi:hypothetical protein